MISLNTSLIGKKCIADLRVVTLYVRDTLSYEVESILAIIYTFTIHDSSPHSTG